MPPAVAKKYNIPEPDEFFNDADIIPYSELERRRAAKLKQSMAADRIAQTRQEVNARENAPANEEAELLQQEYGHPTEIDENDEDDEGGENDAGGEDENDDAQKENEDEANNEQMSASETRQKETVEKQENALRARALPINQQIQSATASLERKLLPDKAALMASKLKDRSVNFVRAVRWLGGIGVSLWFTIIVPLLAILGILIAALLWLIWPSLLGPSSPKTRQLETKIKNERGKLAQELEPLKKELKAINTQLYQLYKQKNSTAPVRY